MIIAACSRSRDDWRCRWCGLSNTVWNKWCSMCKRHRFYG